MIPFIQNSTQLTLENITTTTTNHQSLAFQELLQNLKQKNIHNQLIINKYHKKMQRKRLTHQAFTTNPSNNHELVENNKFTAKLYTERSLKNDFQMKKQEFMVKSIQQNIEEIARASIAEVNTIETDPKNILEKAIQIGLDKQIIKNNHLNDSLEISLENKSTNKRKLFEKSFQKYLRKVFQRENSFAQSLKQQKMNEKNGSLNKNKINQENYSLKYQISIKSLIFGNENTSQSPIRKFQKNKDKLMPKDDRFSTEITNSQENQSHQNAMPQKIVNGLSIENIDCLKKQISCHHQKQFWEIKGQNIKQQKLRLKAIKLSPFPVLSSNELKEEERSPLKISTNFRINTIAVKGRY